MHDDAESGDTGADLLPDPGFTPAESAAYALGRKHGLMKGYAVGKRTGYRQGIAIGAEWGIATAPFVAIRAERARLPVPEAEPN